MKQIFLKTMLVAIATLSGLTVVAQPGYFGPFFTHTSSVSNISNNWTNLSNPALDGNASAKMIITQNWGTLGNYADFKPAVWYAGSPGWAIYNEDGSTAFADSTAWNVLVPNGANGTVFSHTSSSANISGNWTTISHPSLDGNPDAIFFITHNWSGNAVGVYNNHNTGIWYTGTNWAIYNEDLATFPDSAVYDIFVPSSGNGNAFKHTTTSSNTGSNYTIIDNVLTNGQPDRTVFVTHNWEASGIYNDNPIGVWYTGSAWSIFNQNLVTMDTSGVVFNVLVADLASGVEEQTTNANFMTVFPNPATDNINLGYVLTKPGTVNLKIINITGQQVKAVYTGTQSAGNFTMQTNTADLAPGMYSYVLTVDGVVSRKMFVKN
jgi:hypothetical protein